MWINQWWYTSSILCAIKWLPILKGLSKEPQTTSISVKLDPSPCGIKLEIKRQTLEESLESMETTKELIPDSYSSQPW